MTSLSAFCPGIAARTWPGSDEAVLWIHGYTMDSSTWQPLWQRLPDWTHIGIDLPGHGSSAPMDAWGSVTDLARQIGARALDLGIRHVVGLSFGGMVAVQIAIEYPDSFASFAMGSPGLLGGPQAPGTPERYRDLAALYRQRGPGPWMTELWMHAPPDIFKGAAAHPALWQQLAGCIGRHTWQELGTGAMSRMMGRTPPQTTARLRQVLTPTLLMVGDAEMPAFLETAAIMQRVLPHGTLVRMPGAGHLGLLELPECAAERLAGWFRAAARPLAWTGSRAPARETRGDAGVR